MITSKKLEDNLKDFASKGLITSRTENNQYLKISYKGTGSLISDKWNVKIYTTGSVVCNDMKLLEDIINDKVKEPDKNLKLLQIDDAGIGFPLLGAMIGITDGDKIKTGAISVKFFQSPFFEKKEYLRAYSDLGYKIIQDDFKAHPNTHRMEICTGHINTKLKDILRKKGFDVRVTEIKGMLQDNLEKLFKEYVYNTLGKDLAYDPKELTNKKDIVNFYYRVLNWGKKYAPNSLKSGWKSIK